MADDSTVEYFKGIANQTAPLRGEKKTASPPSRSPDIGITAAKPKEASVLKYDDDDLKYMSKQAYKIGERLSRVAGEKQSKAALAKRPAIKSSPKR